MPKVKSFHGCFGRFMGDALESTDFHSDEWTQVRSRMHRDKEGNRISKLLETWKVIQDANWVRNLDLLT